MRLYFVMTLQKISLIYNGNDKVLIYHLSSHMRFYSPKKLQARRFSLLKKCVCIKTQKPTD